MAPVLRAPAPHAQTNGVENSGHLCDMTFVANVTNLFGQPCLLLFLIRKKMTDSKITLQEGEEIIVDNLKVANVFNDYFCDIALNTGFDDSITSSCDAIAKHVNHPSVLKIKDMYKISDDSFHFASVGVSTIAKKLCNIDNKKSQGYDDIPGKLLRLAHSALAPHLTYLVNECLRTSAFPYNMKNAELSPVYKRHDNLD